MTSRSNTLVIPKFMHLVDLGYLLYLLYMFTALCVSICKDTLTCGVLISLSCVRVCPGAGLGVMGAGESLSYLHHYHYR